MGLANSPWPSDYGNNQKQRRSNAASYADGVIERVIEIGPQIMGLVTGPDGTIYVGTGGPTGGTGQALGGSLLAYDLQGNLLWQFKHSEWGDVRSLALDKNGQIYCGAGNEKVVAVNTVNGQQAWQISIDTYPGTQQVARVPLVGDDAVYIANSDIGLWAIDKSGAVLWEYTHPYRCYSEHAFSLSSDVIYLGNSAYLQGVDLSGAKVLDVNLTVGVYGISVGDDGSIMVGRVPNDYTLSAYSGNGDVRWSTFFGYSYPVDARPAGISPDGAKVVIPTDYRLNILDAQDGAILYQPSVRTSEDYTIARNDRVFVLKSPSPYQVLAFGLDGKPLWSSGRLDRGYKIAIGEGGRVIVGEGASGTGRLVIYRSVSPFKSRPPEIRAWEPARSASPVIEVQTFAPEPVQGVEINLHFKIEVFGDSQGNLLLAGVDSLSQPGAFEFSRDGMAWWPFPVGGLTGSNYGALVRAKVPLGPRPRAWLRASVTTTAL